MNKDTPLVTITLTQDEAQFLLGLLRKRQAKAAKGFYIQAKLIDKLGRAQ